MREQKEQIADLSNVMREAIDYLFPLVGPYESAFYMYFLRHTFIEHGTPHIRVGVRPLQTAVIQSAYAGSTIGGGDKPISKISYNKVSGTLKNLEAMGAIRKENDPNRDGTLYRVMLPLEISACQKRKAELQISSNVPVNDTNADYYNVKENRLKVYERDDYTCKYCNKQLTQYTATLDHLTPVARGGDHSLENLVTACLDCNSKKNAKPLGDFIADTNKA